MSTSKKSSSSSRRSKDDKEGARKKKKPLLDDDPDAEHVREVKRMRAYSKEDIGDDDNNNTNGATTTTNGKRRTRSMDATKEQDETETAEPSADDAGATNTTNDDNLTVSEWRSKHSIVLRGHGSHSTTTTTSFPDPMRTFDATPFTANLRDSIQQAGFVAPSPIQAQSWPLSLQGTDLICVAKTGSGSTYTICLLLCIVCTICSICYICGVCGVVLVVRHVDCSTCTLI